MQTIKYYRKNIYGNVHEFIHSDCAAKACIIQKLTGKKSITKTTRKLIHDLSHGQITFTEVIQPIDIN